MAQKQNREQVTLNAQVLGVLREHGDSLTGVREIDHFAYFVTPQLRARFVDRCLAIGFKLRATTEPSEHSDKYGAMIFHSDMPDEEVLGRITTRLIELAQECGGEYDGWETQVVK